MRAARVAKSYHNTTWTQDQIDYLVANHGKITNRELAARLNRSFDAVRQKITDIRRNGNKESINPKRKFLPESKCLSCSLANPLKCDWISCDINDDKQVNKALESRKYISRVDGTTRIIYSIQECTMYVKGKLEVD